MPTMVWTPPNNGTAITFDRDGTTGYKLLKGYSGFANCPVDHRTTKSPAQHGATVHNSDAKPRTIRIPVMILSPNGIHQQKDRLAALSASLNPLMGDGQLEYQNDNGVTVFAYCRGDGDVLEISEDMRSQTYQLVTINLIAYDPFFYSSEINSVSLAAETYYWVPFEIPLTIGGAAGTATAINLGSQEARCTITFNGPMTNPTVSRTATEEGENVVRSITLAITLDTGAKFVVTTGIGHQSATYTDSSGNESNGIPYVSLASDLWSLMPGSNEIALSATGDAGQEDECVVAWYHTYAGA